MRRWMLWLVVATLAVGVAAPAFSGLVAPSGDEALVMVSLSPCAIFDTRTASAGKMTSGETRSFGVVGAGDFTSQGGPNGGCGVPGFDGGVPQAQAVLLNLVAIEAAGGGNLKAWAGDAAEATGGVVNYQALSPAMNNSNAIVLELNQTAQGQDIKLKVNGAGVHVRGVVLGYFVSGDQTFLTYDDYDPDRDGSVAAAELLDGFSSSALAEGYCAFHARHPRSYPAGPCQAVLTSVDRDGDVGRTPSLAIGVDGNPIISYFAQTGRDLKVVHCTDPVCSSWDTPHGVDTTGDVGLHPSLGIGVDGNPVISYYDQTNGDLKVVHCTNAACSFWDTPQTVANVDAECEGTIALAVGVDGNPIVAYCGELTALQLVPCTNPACSSWGLPRTLDPATSHWMSVAIGVDGNPIVSYQDATQFDLKVVHCTDAACNGQDAPRTLDSTGSVGWHTSLAIGVDGNPIISYHDGTNDDLKVVHCTNTTCSSWETPQTLDSASSVVGFSPSIGIGVDGNPVISYYDLANGDLKVVHCTTPACSSWDTPQTLDSTANVGRYTSLAIGVDGNPIISYYDFTNGDLKVARVGR